jgi:hypothetical protein
MIQNVLRAIGGIGVYDTISIFLFISVFGAALVWALRLKKPFLNSMSLLPLEHDDEPSRRKESHE